MRSTAQRLSAVLIGTSILFASLAAQAQSVVRGPYLQQVSSNAITIRWRTDEATDAVVRFGTSQAALDDSATGSESGTEHVVEVTGLSAGTTYWYSIGNSAGALAGGSEEFHFDTAPQPGDDGSLRLWVTGDSGTANSDAAAVRNAYEDFAADNPADLWLSLGDTAYENGTDSEYQVALFDMYGDILRNTPFWPTFSNHDGRTADAESETGPYFDIFTLPRDGEAGGLASGTEAWYSFDYGNVHFVNLDSYDSDRSTDGPMLTWLEDDLAATSQPWIIAYFHHPPYSKGSHDSDASEEFELIEMRENVVPILEAHGVDLVLAGHSHSYERSFFIDDHHGSSDSFDPTDVVDDGDGREDGDGAYRKPTESNPNEGAVYVVAGSSGKRGGGDLDHPAMYYSLRALGSMVIDVNDDRLDAAFIDSNGTRRDYFTIKQGQGGIDVLPPSPPTNLRTENVQQTTLALAWDASSDDVGVAGYRVSRDGELQETVTSTAFSDSGLTAGTEYRYEVVAFDDAGNESQPASLTVTTAESVDDEPPGEVSSLSATAVTDTSLRLTWNAATDNTGVTGYRVRRDGEVAGTTDNTRFDDDSLEPETTYVYGVTALDAAGNESNESTIEVTTAASSDDEPPTTVTNLHASAVTSSSVTLAWDPASDNVAVTGYEVARGGVTVATTDALLYVDSDVSAGTTYDYRVTAVDAAGNVSAAATLSVTTEDDDAPPADDGGGGGSAGWLLLASLLLPRLLRVRRPAGSRSGRLRASSRSGPVRSPGPG